MPDISQFKAPDGTTYNFKDTNSRTRLTSLEDTVVYRVLAEKTYTGIYATGDWSTTANQQENGGFYFAKVIPDNYDHHAEVRYRITVTVPGQVTYQTSADVNFHIYQSSIYTCRVFNTIINTNYRPIYYHYFRRATKAGSSTYGHLLGIGLRASANPTNSSFPRTVKVEILEAKDCTVTLFDSVFKYGSAPGTGSTNYSGLTEIDAYNNGLRETGDDNDITTLRLDNEHLVAGTNKIYRYTLVLQKPDNTWESTVLNSNNANQTGKTYNNSGFVLGKVLLYNNSGSDISSGGTTGDNTIYEATNLFDARYSFNGLNSTTANSTMVAHRPFYIVGTVNASNGLFYLDPSQPWSQSLPTSEDNKVYIFIGRAWDGYRVSLHVEHPVYKYVNGGVRLYSTGSLYAETAETADSAATATTATYSSYPKIVASNEIRFDAATKPSSATDLHIGHKWSDGNGDAKINAYQFKDGNGGLAGIKAKNYNGYTPYSAAGGTISGNVKVGNPTNQTQFPSNGIVVHDTRSVAETPAAISKGVNFFFSNKSMPDSSWWAGMYVRGWEGGYSAWELVGPAHNTDKSTAPLYVRTSNKDTTWGAWRKIYDSVNKPSASDIGAVAKTGDTMSGNLNVLRTDDEAVIRVGLNNKHSVYLSSTVDGKHGIRSNGYWNGTAFTSSPKWITYRDTDGSVKLEGNALTSTSTKYLENQGGSTVSVSTSTWNNYQTKTSLVWGQKWSQTGLTYTPSGGKATAITDTGDFSIFLTQSTTSNQLFANLAVDGKVHAASGFVGNLTGTASALSGLKLSTTANLGIDSTDVNQKIGYVAGLTKADWNYQQPDGSLYQQTYSANWIHQIFGDYRTGQISVRGRSNGTWQSWRRVLDEGNFSNFALALTGGTMTGGITLQTGSSGFNDKGLVWANNTARIGAATVDLGIYSKGSIYIRPGSETAPSADGIVVTTDGLFPGNQNGTETLGGVSSRWANVWSKEANFGTSASSPRFIVQGTTYATNTYADNNPKIDFRNASDSQNISLTFTDHDSVQNPASLTLNGNQGNEYFIAPNIKATRKFYGSLNGDASQVTFNADNNSGQWNALLGGRRGYVYYDWAFQWLDETDATTTKNSYLSLGNTTVTGTSGNKRGILRLYNENQYFVNVLPRGTHQTNNWNYFLPKINAETTLVGTTGALGSAKRPVFVNASGQLAACGYAIAYSSGNSPVTTANSEGVGDSLFTISGLNNIWKHLRRNSSYSITAYTTTATDFTPASINKTAFSVDVDRLVDDDSRYVIFTADLNGKTLVIDIVHMNCSYNNTLYIDFGNANWRAKSIRILTGSGTGAFTVRGTTDACDEAIYAIHSNYGGTTQNKTRFVMYNWANASGQRIVSIGCQNYAHDVYGKPYYAGTADMTAGSSFLATNDVYFVYE